MRDELLQYGITLSSCKIHEGAFSELHPEGLMSFLGVKFMKAWRFPKIEIPKNFSLFCLFILSLRNFIKITI